ncbi:MAG: hypothetical protein MR861_04430, partial [Clostridiales bacterium]|nr:hypothetical protein [Clostridiales bacterium]
MDANLDTKISVFSCLFAREMPENGLFLHNSSGRIAILLLDRFFIPLLPALSNVTPQGVAQSNVTLGVSLNSAKHKKAEALIRLDQCLLPVFESKLDASVPENHRAIHQLCPDLLIPLLK